jgi:hypothetical protein
MVKIESSHVAYATILLQIKGFRGQRALLDCDTMRELQAQGALPSPFDTPDGHVPYHSRLPLFFDADLRQIGHFCPPSGKRSDIPWARPGRPC